MINKKLLVVVCFFAVLQLDTFPRRRSKKLGMALQAPFSITSPAFVQGGKIPRLYTCDGKDISPPFHWDNPPLGTQSFTLISHDPDAVGGSWIHWIIFDIPGAMRRLPREVVPASINAKVGINSWNDPGYGGPCPPLRKHRYLFTLYALRVPKLSVPDKPTIAQVKKAMEGHIVDKTAIMGVYQRPIGE